MSLEDDNYIYDNGYTTENEIIFANQPGNGII
jgi:hypothetical protein